MTHRLGWLAEDYGAVGNGSADDASAFASLIGGMKTRLTANGQQHVGLKPKTYRVNSTITLDASGLQIHGHNRVGTIIEGGPSLAAGVPVIDVVASGGNTQLKDIAVGNLTVRRVNADGPLIRLRGVLGAHITNLILGACNTYVVIDKPGTAANLHVLLSMLDATGGTPATGISATSVDALHLVQCKVKCAGAGANGLFLTTGDHCSAKHCLFENCGNAPLKFGANVTNFLFLGGGRLGTITKWIDDVASSSGNVYGRSGITGLAGTWNQFGPSDPA